MVTERLLALSSSAFLLCCSGGVEPYAPAPAASTPNAASEPSDAVARAPKPAASVARGEGFLELSAAADVTSYLGALHAVVQNADGQVVGGADEEVATPQANDDARNLSLVLPVGEDYTVQLTATTADAVPTTCRASVAGLRIEAGSTARAQIFSWDCDGVAGYVPAALGTDCYWFADWSFVTRTSAAIGELIEVGAAGHDLRGSLPTFTWSTPSANGGTFENPAAAQTSFRCQAAAPKLPLTVKLSAAGCEQQLTQTISCQ